MKKKNIFFIIAIVVVLALVGCSGKKETSSSSNTVTSDGNYEMVLTQAGGVGSILSLGGLSENDIKPDGFIQFMPFDEDTFGIEVSSPLGEAGQQAWVKKIFDKCKQLSSDGKIYRAAYSGDNPSAYEYRDFDQMYSRGEYTWAYPYNGKYICIIIGNLITRTNCSFYIGENE